MNGLMTEERPKSLTVQLDRWAAIDMRYQNSGDGPKLKYRLDGTPSTLALVIFLFFGLVSGILAIPICIYLMFKADRYARRFIVPLLSGGPYAVQGPQEEIKGLLIDGLSESRRLAEEGYRAANSSYEDNILIAVIVDRHGRVARAPGSPFAAAFVRRLQPCGRLGPFGIADIDLGLRNNGIPDHQAGEAEGHRNAPMGHQAGPGFVEGADKPNSGRRREFHRASVLCV